MTSTGDLGSGDGSARRRRARSSMAVVLAAAFVLALGVQAASAATLPDGRAWELVSPPDTHGGFVEPLQTHSEGEGGAIQAAADGDAITYVSNQSLLGEPEGEANLSQVLSRRTSSGWSSEDISPPHRGPSDGDLGAGQEYRLFSTELTTGALQPIEYGTGTPLSPEAGERTPYLRDDTSGLYQPLVTEANVAPGTVFGGDPESQQAGVRFLGGTPDLGHVVLGTGGSLALTGTPVEGRGLYEWSEGRLTLVNLLPEASGGAPVEAYLGMNGVDLRHAISADGSRVFFTAEPLFERHVYARDLPKGETVQLDVVQAGASGAGGQTEVEYQTATPDGSRIFFTDPQQLTTDSGATYEEPDLYECHLVEVAGRLTCELTDLTVSRNAGEPANVLGTVIGASEDGSYVYVVAGGVLSTTPNPAGESAEAHGENLYVLHRQGSTWTATFIAGLSSEDFPDWRPIIRGDLTNTTSRVSPDGHYLAFMSQRPLTGYDNADVSSGAADEEVYMYDAQSTRLVCASCNPSGTRPSGVFDAAESQGALLVDESNPRAWGEHWLAASLPGWTAVDAQHALYQSRYLSDRGRLFFDSADALSPHDANGKEDVYEYEPAGVGSCTGGAETFSSRSEGCISLISSGTSSEESAFLDASESGGDVFFVTTASLTGQAPVGQFALYDAHECTAASPCAVPARDEAPAPCSTGEACRPGSSPTLGPEAPPTAAPIGDGNIAGAPADVAKVKLVKKVVRGRAVSLTIAVPGKGGLAASGSGVRSVRRSLAAAGSYILVVHLAPARTSHTSRHMTRFVIHLRYVPSAGAATTISIAVTVKGGRTR